MLTTIEKLGLSDNSIFLIKEFKLPRFTSPRHFHTEYELIYIKKSYGKLYVGDTIKDFTEGSLYLFGPYLPHCFFNSKDYELDGELAHAIVIQFKPDFLGEKFLLKTETNELKNLFDRATQGIQFDVETALNVGNTIEQILKMNGLSSIVSLFDSLKKLTETKSTILLTSENYVPELNKVDQDRLNEIYRYVLENFTDEIDFKKASQISNMNPAAFCRYFKRRTKKTFTEFVNEIRLTHAKKLLIESSKNISEIGYACGFENLSYFNRQFKKQNGVNPMDFRKDYI